MRDHRNREGIKTPKAQNEFSVSPRISGAYWGDPNAVGGQHFDADLA
jgi:hypothetical protein